MREANWDDVFQRRQQDGEDDRLSSVLPWEEWLTLGIAFVIFLACVSSIQSAKWVDDMPSMYPVGFAGLLAGYALARLRRPGFLLFPTGLLLGAGLVYLQLIAILPGGSLVVRTEELVRRMEEWWYAVTNDGINTDTLPFITMLLALTYIGAFFSTWAIFRWRNVWLGLVPGGFGLLWNISFVEGQFSFAFVIFCFAAVLLVMRLHVQQKQEDWAAQHVRYPEFMSLSVLNATFWVSLLLLAAVWMMPLAHRSDTAGERWEDFTSPITRHLTPYARVFVGVNARKPINVHNLPDALPLQGKVTLHGKDAVVIEAELSPEMAHFLRDQSFDEYTENGWKINVNGVPIDPGQDTGVNDPAPAEGARQDVTINITVKGGNDDRLFSVGQPVQTDQPVDARVGEHPADVSSLEPAANLENDDTYATTGSVAIPSVQQLEAAGVSYPEWIADRYLQLPRGLPERVQQKAIEVTTGAGTPFEQALAVEAYLRTFPADYDVPSTPPGRDSIDYFLFDLQRGYFDYHASAMAVMLRTLGVPARVATGYVIDPFTLAVRDGRPTYALTQKQAYAWPEVYFPGVGWVEFSPSPEQPLIARRVDLPPGTTDDRGANSDATGAGQDEINLGALDDEPIARDGDPTAIPETDGSGSSRALLILLGALGAVVLVGAATARFAWEYGMGGLSQPARLWEKTRRLAILGRIPPEPSETPREYARRLGDEVPGAGAAGYVAASYESARFGQHSLPDDDNEKLESAWASLRNALVRRALRLRPRG